MSDPKERNADDSEGGSDAAETGTQGGTTRKPKTTIGELMYVALMSILLY
jgi:hypothetical protein